MPAFEGCCAHDHDCEEASCGPAWSLHKHIDLHNVRCLNEAAEGSAQGVFRAWDKRLEAPDTLLESNDDDLELLLHIPFEGAAKVKALCIIGVAGGYSPSEVRVFTNRDDLDFGTANDLPPVQRWDLAENLRGDIELPCNVAKFSGVHSLDLHFPSNYGADTSRISFIGIKGEFSERKREAVQAVYEVRPVPGPSNKVIGDQGQHFGAAT